jgi:hypothetical protein
VKSCVKSEQSRISFCQGVHECIDRAVQLAPRIGTGTAASVQGSNPWGEGVFLAVRRFSELKYKFFLLESEFRGPAVTF